jgi:hypothetical protein
MVERVVVDATRKRLFIQVKDKATGLAIPITGWTARLQGKSKDLNGTVIDVAGVIEGSAANGTWKWDPIVGTGYPAEGQLPTDGALYVLQVRYVDDAGKVDYGAEFEFAWDRKPV